MPLKILIQFDGSNFYKKVKKLLSDIHLTHYDYVGLAKLICQNDEPQVIYYVGEIRRYKDNKKSARLYSSQQSLFSSLRKQDVEVKLGYLLQSDGVFHEKGVDVQIAVDIVRGAIKNEYDACYLISSDTDLLPAIKTARDERKRVIYVGFENAMSKALLNNCSSSFILTKEILQQFAPKKTPRS